MTRANAFTMGRRSFVVGTSAAASLGLAPLASTLRAHQPGDPHRFVSFYFQGGWDVLLGPDPRDPATNPAEIDLGTELLAAEYRDPFPVTVGDEEVLWGPTMGDLVPHADVLTMFRGVNMNTVAHSTGRAYINTFQPPAGVVPTGDSIATVMAAGANVNDFILPNLSIRVPSFNASFGPEATGIGMGDASDVTNLLAPVEQQLDAEALALLRAAQDGAGSCVGPDASGDPVDQVQVARERVRDLLDLGLDAEFDFDQHPDIAARYNMTNPSNGREPSVIAATTYRLFELGLSTAVTAQLVSGLDSHGEEWATDQPAKLQEGFAALGTLLADLRATDPNLENTTVLVYSEFGRTPRINGRTGRDHWFANSVLVFGGKLRRGVFGATVPDTLGLMAVDLDSGLPSEAGEVIRPEHIAATLTTAQGIEHDGFRVDPLNGWIA